MAKKNMLNLYFDLDQDEKWFEPSRMSMTLGEPWNISVTIIQNDKAKFLGSLKVMTGRKWPEEIVKRALKKRSRPNSEFLERRK